MSSAMIGLYTAKSVFQVHVVNETEDGKRNHLAAARFNPTTEAIVR
jgi:hypothetical protein